MRVTLFLLSALLLAGVVLGGGGTGQAIRDQATASAAYIQDDFLKKLKTNLKEQLGNGRGSKMMLHLEGTDLEHPDVLEIMNGTCSNSDLEEYFGAKRSEYDRVREVLLETVRDKDKCGFFGIMLETMVGDFDVDPTGEFAKQACGAKEEISDETMDKLLKGSTSKRLMDEAFGFGAKDDQKFMSKIVRSMKETPFASHPMMKSLGLGDPKKYSPKKFRKLSKGMTGYGSFGDGKAGGVAFDPSLPPTPYFGKNMAKAFEGGR